MMKRRITQTIVALLAIVSSATAQTLSVASVEAKAGEQAELVVNASDISGVTALQFNLTLPQGITLNESAITKGSAASGHTLSVQTMNNGDRLIVLYHMDLGLFTNGTLLRLPITTGQQTGNFSGSLSNIRTATPNAVSYNCANATFNITVAAEEQPVTITAENKSMVYGDNVPTLTFTTTGAMLNGTPKLSTTATKTSAVGTYPIKVEKGTVTNTNVTYVDGTLTIGKAPLTIAAGTYTKKQGEALPEFTFSYEGFKNNETKAVLTKQATVSCSATEASAPGEYPVTVSGAEAQNYAISYTNGKLIVVAADAVIVKAKSYTREYGEANPTFEFTTEGAVLEGTPEIICEAKATSPVGNYDIIVKQGTVTNYNVTYVNGTLTIGKAPLTVSVGNYSREQGQDNPAFVLTYQGWKNGESESVLLSKPVATTTATKNSAMGDYPITISGGQAQNYKFEYVNGVLTITASTFISRILASGKPFDVFTLSGQKVRSQATSLESLPKGVYIIEGRKVTFR